VPLLRSLTAAEGDSCNKNYQPIYSFQGGKQKEHLFHSCLVALAHRLGTTNNVLLCY